MFCPLYLARRGNMILFIFKIVQRNCIEECCFDQLFTHTFSPEKTINFNTLTKSCWVINQLAIFTMGWAHAPYPTIQFVPWFMQVKKQLGIDFKTLGHGFWSTPARILIRNGRWDIRGGRTPRCDFVFLVINQSIHTKSSSVDLLASLCPEF
jgi:hypothetical protein